MKNVGTVAGRAREFVAAQAVPDRVTDWAGRITDEILDSLPAIASDPDLPGVIRRSAEAQWTAFLATLEEPGTGVPMVPPAAEMAIAIAQRGRSLQELFQIYRIARRAVWEYVTDVLTEKPSDAGDTALLVFVWDQASHWIDSVVEASAALFENERDQVREGAAAQRLETVREVLDRRSSATAKDLAAALGGHPVSGHNTAVVLAAADVDRVGALHSVAIDLAKSAGVRNPLVVSPGGRDLWVWLGTSKAPSLDRLVAAKPHLGASGIQVAVGAPGEGIDGFRQSHLDAQHARRIAAEAHGLANPVYFPDVEALVMLRQSGDLATRFTHRTLGGLAETGRTAARLRETARVMLGASSVEKAASLLSVHKNTVRYRLSQIEEILGHDLDESPIALALALEYHEAFLANGDAPASG